MREGAIEAIEKIDLVELHGQIRIELRHDVSPCPFRSVQQANRRGRVIGATCQFLELDDLVDRKFSISIPLNHLGDVLSTCKPDDLGNKKHTYFRRYHISLNTTSKHLASLNMSISRWWGKRTSD